MQYHDQFQPPGDRAAAAEDRAVEVGRIGEVGDPAHAARPDHRRAVLVAAGGDHVGLRQRLDLGLDADRRQILLDRLGDARVGVGVHGVELGLEAVLEAGLGQQLLGLLDVVGDSPCRPCRSPASTAAAAGWPAPRGR